MILNESVLVFGSIRKPRASGDDPTLGGIEDRAGE